MKENATKLARNLGDKWMATPVGETKKKWMELLEAFQQFQLEMGNLLDAKYDAE
jgi:hypothetical protein